MLHDEPVDFLSTDTPVDVLTVTHSSLRQNAIRFNQKSVLRDHGKTQINLIGCTFRHAGDLDLVVNEAEQKVIELQTTSSIVMNDTFRARIKPGAAKVTTRSDLNGLE